MIETVSDLIEELKKYDGNMPVKKVGIKSFVYYCRESARRKEV